MKKCLIATVIVVLAFQVQPASAFISVSGVLKMQLAALERQLQTEIEKRTMKGTKFSFPPSEREWAITEQIERIKLLIRLYTKDSQGNKTPARKGDNIKDGSLPTHFSLGPSQAPIASYDPAAGPAEAFDPSVVADFDTHLLITQSQAEPGWWVCTEDSYNVQNIPGTTMKLYQSSYFDADVWVVPGTWETGGIDLAQLVFDADFVGEVQVTGFLQGVSGELYTFDTTFFVPEPTTLSLLALGGLAIIRRRRKR